MGVEERGLVEDSGLRAVNGHGRVSGVAPVGSPVTLQLAECRLAVNRRLVALIDAEQPFGALFEHVFSSPGKRVRASLVLANASILGTEDPFARDALDLACSAEMLHEASLIHDDICDASLLRRGIASAPARFAIQFSARAGFFLAGEALDLIAGVLERRPDFRQRLVAAPPDCVLLHHLWRLSLGQILENLPPSDPTLLRHHYRVVAKEKTGTLFRFAGSYGAILAGCDPAVLGRLMDFADHFALAFQIMDDIRDLEGAPSLGKEPGTDLGRHIPTWPLIEWLDGSAEARRLWDDSYTRPLSPDGVQALCHRIVESGATEQSYLVAVREARQARDALACFGNTTGTALLGELCSNLVRRD